MCGHRSLDEQVDRGSLALSPFADVWAICIDRHTFQEAGSSVVWLEGQQSMKVYSNIAGRSFFISRAKVTADIHIQAYIFSKALLKHLREEFEIMSPSP